jgi:uncharacterized membrane protein YjgN (DUF898 family)
MGGQYFKIYFFSGLILMGISIPFLIFSNLFLSVIQKEWLLAYISPVMTYAGYVISVAYLNANTANLVWNNTRLGPLCFYSSMRFKELMKLYLANAVGIICSLGLLIPWAVIRTRKYRIDNLRVFQEDTLILFNKNEMNAVTAAGAETLDFFDMDFSI